jgi:uncharacterized protein (TIGR02001 family)
MKKVVASLVAAIALSVGAASAADLKMVRKAPVVVETPSPWDFAFGAALMNDYVFRGITQSNHKPSVAAYFEPRYNINKDLQLYIGVAGESISFPNRAASEIDIYGGIRPTFGALALDFGFWYYYYPGGQCFNAAFPPGTECFGNGSLPVNGNVVKSSVSFWEVYFKPTWNVNDQLALGATVFYTPSFLNSGADGTYVSGTAKYTFAGTPFIPGLGTYISGEFGRQFLGTSDSFYGCPGCVPPSPNGINYVDYNTWNIGIGFTAKVFTLDLRYSDTDLSKGDCNAFTSDHTASQVGFTTAINPAPGFGSNWCGSTFIAKFSADLTLASLKP